MRLETFSFCLVGASQAAFPYIVATSCFYILIPLNSSLKTILQANLAASSCIHVSKGHEVVAIFIQRRSLLHNGLLKQMRTIPGRARLMTRHRTSAWSNRRHSSQHVDWQGHRSIHLPSENCSSQIVNMDRPTSVNEDHSLIRMLLEKRSEVALPQARPYSCHRLFKK